MKITIQDISRKLSDQAEAVCRKLLPGGKIVGGEWVCGSSGGEAGDSLKVHLTGPHAGEWRDWANQDEHGDLLDLWRFVMGMTPAQSVSAAKEFLGIRESVYEVSEKSWKSPKSGITKAISEEGLVMKYLTGERRLSPTIINKFKVEGDHKRKAIVFPSYTPANILVNRSYRTLDKEKKVWQEEGCAPCLFGWQALSERAYRERTIILAEGQIDAMTWTEWGFDALSIPNGGGQTWIDYEWSNLEIFSKIYLAFDMDAAGDEMCKKAIARLGKHRCFRVKMPHKDANDCLKVGNSYADARKWLDEADQPLVENLVSALDLRKRLLEESKPKPEVPTFPPLKYRWPDSGYFPRPGEVTIWTGEMNQGKSSLLNHFVACLLVKSTKCFVASLETKAEKLVKKMVSCALGQACDEESVEIFLKECGSDLIFADCTGYIKQDTLMEMMYFSFYRYGVTQFFVDSLMRIQGLEEDYPAQGEFMNRLQRFVKDTDTHVHLVTHDRKAQPGQKGSKGTNIKGSSLIGNNADNINHVGRNPDKEKLREDGKLTPEKDAELHDTEVRVCKQRETGWQGKINLKYFPSTGHFAKFVKKVQSGY